MPGKFQIKIFLVETSIRGSQCSAIHLFSVPEGVQIPVSVEESYEEEAFSQLRTDCGF